MMNPCFNDRTGEVNINNQGLKMIIKEYRGFDDIDIKFEDGTVIYNRTYQSFKNGSASNPNYNKFKARIGQTNINKQGLKMTIKDYRSALDIDVIFEDGTTITNRSYHDFKIGKIINPNCKRRGNKVGETTINKQGLKMTIDVYRSSKDIDIRFEDGVVLKHRTYAKFKQGDIVNQDYKNKEYLENKIGEEKVNNQGLKMIITAVRGSNDIDVKFEDGTELTNRQYSSFRAGTIKNPNYMSSATAKALKSALYKTVVNSQGLKMTVIAYRGNSDIDVQFEDGTKLYHKNYSNFKHGGILNPNYNQYEARVGEVRVNKQGFNATLIAYRSFKDVDIRFDDGTEVHNKSYNRFRDGDIVNPNVKVESTIHLKTRDKRIGETNTNKQGLRMTIVEYRGSTDLDVKFDDNTIVCNKSYLSFKDGKITNPNKVVGESNINSQGLRMTVITYRGYKDLNVRFDDGTIVYNKPYSNFKSGLIVNPNYRFGEIRLNNQGLKMTITGYRSAKDIDITFEDGTVVNNSSYIKFKNGEVRKPTYNRLGEENINSQGLKMVIKNYNTVTDMDVEFDDGTIISSTAYQGFKSGSLQNPNFKKGCVYKGYLIKGLAFRLKDNIDTYYYCSKNNEDVILRPCDM